MNSELKDGHVHLTSLD